VVPWTKVLRRAFGGAVIAGIIAALLVYLLYTLFFQGGVRSLHLGDQMIPIYIVIISIGVLLGALLGAATVLSAAPVTEEPPSQP
jgi:hypothetical protein